MSSPEAWLRQGARTAPNAIAIRFGETETSFAALDRHIDAMATILIDRGLVSGRCFGAVTGNAMLLGLLSLAVPRAGGAFLPVNPRLPQPQIDALFAKAGVAVALADRPLSGPVAGLDPACFTRSALESAPVPDGLLSPAPGEAIHLIIATSGSTGEPKGAMLRGSNLSAAVKGSRRSLPVDPGDVWLGCLPLFHIGGLSVLFRCLEAGATMLLHPRFDPEAVGRNLTEGQATHVSLVPAMLAQLIDMECRPSPRLRHVLIGGASLPAVLAERAIAAGWPIHPSYGMSEAGSQVATWLDARTWRPGLAGDPLPGVMVGTSSTGRIRIRGPQVMAGYVNPTLTPGTGLDPDGWFETSDLGGLDGDGHLTIIGRADDLLISGGENVAPAMVEDLAGRCPGVEAIAVTGRPDPAWGDLLVAVVVGPVSRDTFLTWCREQLPSHLRPRAMISVAALPVTAGGKLDRRALRQLVVKIQQTSP